MGQVYTVYRYYDSSGDLLYVGATGKGHRRVMGHKQTAAWWALVVRGEFEQFTIKEDAYAREWHLIGELRPVYNITRPAQRTIQQQRATYRCRYCHQVRRQPRGSGGHRQVCKNKNCQAESKRVNARRARQRARNKPTE